MQPLSQTDKEKLLRCGINPSEIEEYERLLAERSAKDPSTAPSAADDVREKRIAELYKKFYSEEPKSSLKKKIIEIHVAGFLICLLIGIGGAVLHPAFTLISWLAKKFTGFFPILDGVPGIVIVVGYLIFILLGIFVLKGGDRFARVPLMKYVKEIKHGVKIVMNGLPVKAILGPVRIYGFASPDYRSAPGAYTDVFLPHSPTVITGQPAGYPKNCVFPANTTRAQMILYFVSGGMIPCEKS